MSVVKAQINDFSLQSSSVVSSRLLHDDSPNQSLNLLNVSRRDGQKLISSQFQPKTITIVGQLKGSNQTDLDKNIDTFKRSVNVTQGNLDISMAGGFRRYVVALQSVIIERASYNLTFVPFSVSFSVYDPPFARNVLSLGGGLVVEQTLSVEGIAVASYETTITFDGSADPKPRFTAVIDTPGTLGDISLKNETTGDQITVGTAWVAGDQLVVDTENQTVVRTGQSIDFDGIFPEFELGANKILLSLIDTGALNASQTDFDSDAAMDNNIEEGQTFQPTATTNYSQIAVLLKKNVDQGTISITESFDLTTNKDGANTTGNWDTTNGIATLALSADVTDQSQTSNISPIPHFFGQFSFLPNYWAQSFVPSVTAPLSKIVLNLFKVGTPTDNVVVELRPDGGSNTFQPSSVVTESVNVAGGGLGTSSGVATTISFSGTNYLTSGTTYWIVVHRSGAEDSSNYFKIDETDESSSSVDYYPAGVDVFSLDGSPNSWSAGGVEDLIFTEKYKSFNTSNNIIQSLGYDTGNTTNQFISSNVNVDNNGGSIVTEYSDSANNSSFGSWTSDITTLNRRYIRFRVTITGAVTYSPIVRDVTMTYAGQLQATLWNTSAGLPTTAIETITLNYSQVSLSYSEVLLTFTPRTLTSGTTYAVSILPIGFGITVSWGYKNTDAYASGQRVRRIGRGFWVAQSTNDMYFKLFKALAGGWAVDAKIDYTQRFL